MQMLLVVTAIATGLALSGPAIAKTAFQCSAEYDAQRASLLKKKILKAVYIARCRAQPGGAAGPSSAALPRKPAAGKAKAPSVQATGADQFSTEARAEAACQSDTVVWVNTKTGIYHFKGDGSFGRAKPGVFMCEQDATVAGHRSAGANKRP